jgi:purine-binding chemotaxis protein CheW
MMTGIVVDSVSEVLDIQEDQIEDSPDFGVDVDTNFILGIGKIKDEVKILLDIDRVLDSDDLSRMSRMGNEVAATGTPEISEEALESVGA